MEFVYVAFDVRLAEFVYVAFDVSTRMTHALRWAALRDILFNVPFSVMGLSLKTVSVSHTTFEEKRQEPKAGTRTVVIHLPT